MQDKVVKIQDIEANYDHILSIVGSDSFVNWELFTKSSSELNKQMEELARGLSIYRQIQQKRFLIAMKKLKSTDIPDLIKTVKSKKLPREALKTIIDKFQFDQNGKLKLITPIQSLKADSNSNFVEYTLNNDQLTHKLKQATQIVGLKIHESGLYEEPQPPRQIVSTFKANFSEAQLEQIKKQVKVQYQPGTDHISIQTYGQIVHNTLNLVKDEYKRLTLEARAKQRSLINDSKKYIQSLIEYLNNTQALILQGQRLVAKTAGLEQKKVQQSQIGLMQKGLAQTILLIQSGLRTSIKQSIVPEHQVNFQTTKKIVRAQVQLVKQKTPFFKEMLSDIQRSPQNFQIMPLIIALTLNDFIYLTYKLQQQDFMKAVNDQIVMNNPQVSAIFKQMQTAIIKLMRDTGIISEDMAKVIQMQSQNIQNQAGDVYNNYFAQNATGGVLPGSNPLDLLLDSQKHQFDQMKGKKL